MALNDILSRLMIKIGVKKSETALCAEAICRHEDRIKDFNDLLGLQLEDVKKLENRIRALKTEYDSAGQAGKRLYESQIRSLMKDFGRAREIHDLTLRNLEKEKLLLQNRRLELENLQNPVDESEIDDVIAAKDELVTEIRKEDEVISELENTVYSRNENAVTDSDGILPDSERDALLEKDLSSLLGDGQVMPPKAVDKTVCETA